MAGELWEARPWVCHYSSLFLNTCGARPRVDGREGIKNGGQGPLLLLQVVPMVREPATFFMLSVRPVPTFRGDQQHGKVIEPFVYSIVRLCFLK